MGDFNSPNYQWTEDETEEFIEHVESFNPLVERLDHHRLKRLYKSFHDSEDRLAALFLRYPDSHFAELGLYYPSSSHSKVSLIQLNTQLFGFRFLLSIKDKPFDKLNGYVWQVLDDREHGLVIKLLVCYTPND